MTRSKTTALLVVFFIYVAVAFLVRDSYVLLLIATLLFGVVATVIRNVFLIKRDKPCHINITTEDARIFVNDSRIIIEENLKKSGHSAKSSD